MTPVIKRTVKEREQRQSNANHLNSRQSHFSDEEQALSPSFSVKQQPFEHIGTPSTVASTPEQRQEGSPVGDFDDDISPIPTKYITCIQKAFGTDVDLYADVFCVHRRAGAKELRIAYFRRGRQVLSSSPTPSGSGNSPSPSKQSKERFQAVSMAYEILSTPEFKSYYDNYGFAAMTVGEPRRVSSGQPEAERWDAASSATSNTASSVGRPKSPILRQTQVDWSLRRQQTQQKDQDRQLVLGSAGHDTNNPRSRSIRWSEEVEELLYKQEPEEIQYKAHTPLDIMMGEPPKRVSTRKVKKKVVLEAQELTRHLEDLNRQDHRGSNFVGNFLNDIEASLDGIEASVEEFVRFAMSGPDGPQQEYERDSWEGEEEKNHYDEKEQDELDNEDCVSIPSDAPPEMLAPREVDDTLESEPLEPPVPVSEVVTDSDTSFGSRSKKRVRERVMVLVGGNKTMSIDTADCRSESIFSEGKQAEAEVSADSLFALLTKPPPADIVSDSIEGVISSNNNKNSGDDGFDDDANQLFASLTKPVPKNFIESGDSPELLATSQLNSGNENPSQAIEKLSKQQRSHLGMSVRDKARRPREQQSSKHAGVGTVKGVNLEQAEDERPLPNWIQGPSTSGNGANEDAFSVSTMSFSETTEQIREKLVSLRSTAPSAAPAEPVEREPPIPENEEAKRDTSYDTGLGAVLGVEDAAKAASAISQGLNDSFEAILAFGDYPDHLLRVPRTQSAVSSITGHVPSSPVRAEKGPGRFCGIVQVTEHELDDQEGTVKSTNKGYQIHCSQDWGSENENDFVGRFSSYVKALGNEISKFGTEFAMMVESTIAIPDAEAQNAMISRMGSMAPTECTGAESVSHTV